MENRPPAPEDAKNAHNLHVSRAEGIAAWLHSQRNEQRPKGIEHDVDDDDEEEEGKQEGKRRQQRPLKLGILPISLGEEKSDSSAVKPAQHNETDAPVHEDDRVRPERVEYANETVNTVEQVSAGTVDQPEVSLPQHDALVEAEQADLQNYEEDFRLWEEELRHSGPEAGAADMQMSEEENDPQPQVSLSALNLTRASRGSHALRAPSARAAEPAMPSPEQPDDSPVTMAGGGGNIPPLYPGHASHESPDYPPIGPDARPNVVSNPKHGHESSHDHSHEHGHPRLALAMAAAVVVEHMVGKSADKRIEKASIGRDDKLEKQIKRNKIVQEQAQQSFETRLAEELARQRQVQAAEHVRVNNVERTVAVGRTEKTPRPLEVVNTKIGTETSQSVEQTGLGSQEAQLESRSHAGAVMEQVTSATEFDEPVERVYERRQEVKDEPSSPAGAAGGAASVGSVLTKQNPLHQDGYQATQVDGGGQQTAGSSSGQGHGIDYHAAAVRGVGAGLAVIVLALLAYLLL